MRDVIPFFAGRSAFGHADVAYTGARPDYPARVYQILRASGAIKPGTRGFEIGAGSGQASERLLDMGCHLTAIEPDRRLCATLQARLTRYAMRLSVKCATFEEVALTENDFDFAVAATSLHWLNPESALEKAFSALRPSGWFAMWWTVYGDPDNPDDFQRRTHPLFSQLSQSPSYASSRPFALEREKRQAELRRAGFTELSCEEIRWTPSLSTEQVRRLTATFSPVSQLEPALRNRFLDDISQITDEEFGGHVQRNFVTAIYLAQK